jgi:GNAT superfamily N-acetyltransferase
MAGESLHYKNSVHGLTTRLLVDADLPAIDALCRRHPLRLLSPRLSIERYGCETSLLRVWGAFRRDYPEELMGLMQRFGNTVVLVDADGDCGFAFARIVDDQTGVLGLRGTAETIDAVRACLTKYQGVDCERSPFLRLLHPPQCDPALVAMARPATMDDLDELAFLYSGAGVMYRSRANVAAKLADSRVFVIQREAGSRRRIDSVALLNVEGAAAGLIGGVYTRREARGQGFAAAVTAALSIDLQRDGKQPCLFYENPVAGRVYRRLGFEDAGDWSLLYVHELRGMRSTS